MLDEEVVAAAEVGEVGFFATHAEELKVALEADDDNVAAIRLERMIEVTIVTGYTRPEDGERAANARAVISNWGLQRKLVVIRV